MSQLFLTIVAGLAVFAAVVIFHELAHFFVARAFGVATECFSIGFGPAIWSRVARDGTRYQVALIPLGGYVKMKGEQHPGNDASSGDSDAFHNKPVWQRMLVVLAGPFSNFVLAAILFWVLLFGGQTTIKPVVGQVAVNSIAAKSGIKPGDEIISIAGAKVTNWQQVLLHLSAKIGARDQLQIGTKLHADPEQVAQQRQLKLAGWKNDALEPNPLLSLGITPYHPQVRLRVDKIMPNSPAAKAGVRLGDHIIGFAGKKISSWDQLQKLVAASADKSSTLEVKRNGKKLFLPVKIASRHVNGAKRGSLGVASYMKPWPKSMLLHRKFTPGEQITTAVSQVGFYTWMNVKILGRLLTGNLSIKSLGGPIMIFQVAGQAAAVGWKVYVQLIAIISILVGFFNLLPIPLVDGGVFVFQVVELLRSKPAPIWVQNMVTQLGLVLILYLFVQATYNDVLRFF